ncbi:MAG: creatininase family protein, partial [Candidatus Bipolaricaulota bacterium]|nr:creatininase family protein [Candidatus Bipolaricaulota bacterium]MDW8141216.1 creatininase family protein [Candidatus Bipolaricaulota bacterium]
APLPLDTLDFSQSGATLDPREASPEAGRKILRTAQERLAKLALWLQEVPEKELQSKPHLL